MEFTDEGSSMDAETLLRHFNDAQTTSTPDRTTGTVLVELPELNAEPPYILDQLFYRKYFDGLRVEGKYVSVQNFDEEAIYYYRYQALLINPDNEQISLDTTHYNRPMIEADIATWAHDTYQRYSENQVRRNSQGLTRRNIDPISSFSFSNTPSFDRIISMADRGRSSSFARHAANRERPDHYTSRQNSRAERTNQEYRRNEEKNKEKYVNEIIRLNKLLPASEHFTNVCSFCLSGVNSNKKEYSVYNGEIVCKVCSNTVFRPCGDCRVPCLRSDLVETGKGLLVCDACTKKYTFTCDMCECIGEDSYKKTSKEGDARCTQCASDYKNLTEAYDMEDESEIFTRSYSTRKLAKFCSPQLGTYVKSKRLFGVELECFYENEDTAAAVLNKQPYALGVSGDGTIADNNGESDYGIELQTPKLQGKNGEEFLFQLSSKIIEAGFGVNKTCGMHVHLDSKDYLKNVDAAKSLMAFYVVFEDVILSLLPRSRRSNEYCRRLGNEYKLSDIINAENMEALERAWYKTHSKTRVEELKDTRHDSRYSGINFHTFFAEGHMEVRYHNGTIVAPKILEWVNLHCQIMDLIIAGNFGRSEIMAAQEESQVADKAEIMFDLLGLSQRSKDYFFERQEKFKVRSKIEDEVISAPF